MDGKANKPGKPAEFRTALRAKPDSRNRAANHTLRRQQLIAGAIQAVAIHGYSATTVAQIAAFADLSHGLVNFHFGSKAALLEAVLRFMVEDYDRSWRTAVARHPEGRRRVEAMLEAALTDELCSPQRLAVWFSFWGEASARPLYRSISLELEQKYQAALSEAIAAIAAPEDAMDLAACLSTAVDGLWLEMHLAEEPIAPAEARGRILRYLSLMLRHR